MAKTTVVSTENLPKKEAEKPTRRKYARQNVNKFESDADVVRAQMLHAFEMLAAGAHLHALPISIPRIYAAMRDDPELKAAYDMAQKIKAEVLASKAMSLAEEAPDRYETQYGDRIDPGHVAWTRSRLDMARWYAGVLDRGRFGQMQRVEEEHENANAKPTFIIESSREVVDAARTIENDADGAPS